MHQHRRDARQGKPSEGPVELQFVVSTTDEKPDPELRKFIRSHVMKGKNKGKILKKRNPIREQDDVPSASGSLPTASTIVTGNRIFDDVQSAQIPRKFGSDFCSVRFADSVEPKTVEVVIQCKPTHLFAGYWQRRSSMYSNNVVYSLVDCQKGHVRP
jgi:hypothetical protein